MYQIVKMDLFTAPSDSFIVHACNTKGQWGSGIAKFMKDKYPKNNQAYRDHCFSNSDERLIGSAFIPQVGSAAWKERRVISLFTSVAYGIFKDPPHKIIQNTKDALVDLFLFLSEEYKQPEINVYSNMFNSGLFNVPWSDTENVLKHELDIFESNNPEVKINWTVCSWN